MRYRPFLALFAALLVFPGSATAATHNITGNWSCCGSGGAGAQVFKITTMSASGAFSGKATYPSGAPFSPITGTVSGNTVTLTTGPYYGSSYSATFTGTISANDRSMSGTWKSNASQSGTWTATRTSGGGGGGGGGGTDQRRATTTRVSCNRGPDPDSDYSCTAAVAGVGGSVPAPSGTVKWTTRNGSFRYGHSCTLQPNATTGAPPACAVTLIQGQPRIGLGTAVPVVAGYQGDATYRPSSSAHPVAGAVQLPHAPSVCTAKPVPGRPGVVTYDCRGMNLNPCRQPTLAGDVIDIIPAGYYVGPAPTPEARPKPKPCPTDTAAATVFTRAAALKPPSLAPPVPRRRSDIGVTLGYVVHLADNGANSSKIMDALRSAGAQGLVRRGAFVAGATSAVIPYAGRKVILVRVVPALRSALKSLPRSGVAGLAVRLQVAVRRRGDRKAVTRTQPVLLGLPAG